MSILAGFRRQSDITPVRAGLLGGCCLLCGQDSASAILCPACVAALPTLPATRCPRCSLPTPYGEHCGACLHRPPAYDAVHAAFPYAFPIDRLIQAFKYGHELTLASFFSAALARTVESARPRIDCVVPLPLHPRRLAERGFNQAMELARPLARRWSLPLAPAPLVRERYGDAQASLPLKHRPDNVRHAFAVQGDYRGRHALLIDDVMTSGATLDEASRVLKLHGAASVQCAVIARALPH